MPPADWLIAGYLGFKPKERVMAQNDPADLAAFLGGIPGFNVNMRPPKG